MKRIISFIFCIMFAQIQYAQIEFQPIAFQSTSIMPHSGSSLASNPILNNDGTASYNGATYTPNKVGVRKNTPGTPGQGQDINQQPIGDTPWPLMIMIIGFYIIRKKWKRMKSST